MTALVLLVVLLPLLGGLTVAVGASSFLTGTAMVAGGLGAFASAVVLAVRVSGSGAFHTWSGFIYVDSLGAFFALVVSLVVVLASFGSVAYISAEEERGEFSHFQVRLYFVFFSVFASAMLAVFLTGNLGLLWTLIEASTLASVVLVGLEAKARSLEAAWKYVIISSFGVTIALVATLFLFYSASALHLSADQRLTWAYLFAHGHSLAPASMRLAFLLAVIGYGTKVGLVPMHTWLPDAHSEAPSPVSAMLSAGLLNTGMYAIIRYQAIARAALGTAYPSSILLLFGFLSVFLGVMFLVLGGNFKRLFAYSSVEHMGVISVALGFGGVLGIYGALLQVLTHAIGKAVLFLSSGHVVLGYRTRESAKVRGMLGSLPLAGAVLLLASLAVAGSPPFGVFLSELTIVRAGFAGSAVVGPVLAGLLVLLLVIGFISLLATTLGMVAGDGPPAGSVVAYPKLSGRVLAAVPLVGGLAALAVLGLWVPVGLNELIMHSVKVVL
ncbi:MAG TPA: proton-conducting transporter membrane subunit [Acidimicrobiales bacterium]|nr:proton-conducting transporter membrane subunit [Acidimicrobiales bacterium]